MRKDKHLTKEAKAVVATVIEQKGEMAMNEIVDLIRPHFAYDARELYENALKKKARNVMAGIKDKKGVRSCYSDNKGNYHFIDTTRNMTALFLIEKQLKSKYVGLNKSLKKVRKRKTVLDGQMSMFENGTAY